MKRENLTRAVNDRSRKVKIRGNHAIVPLKFDAEGNPATVDKLIFKRLSLLDLRFLAVWRENDFGGEITKLAQKAGITNEKAEQLIKKLSCFRAEQARVKALCEIPTPAWIAAKHVQNVYEGGPLQDSQHRSLAELAKIEGAYKQQALTNQLNVFNISLTPEQEAVLKPVFDTLATHDAA